jgi:hypothetical protein
MVVMMGGEGGICRFGQKKEKNKYFQNMKKHPSIVAT